jgi:hypothetical protein
LQKLYAKGKE